MSNVIKWALAGTFGSIVALTALQMAFKDERPQHTAVTVEPRTDEKAHVLEASAKVNTSPLSRHLVEACKGALAVMNSRDAKTLKGHPIDGVTAHVTWVRPDDGKKWQARCEIVDDSHIRWAAFDAFGDGKQGRWRNEDSIAITIKTGSIKIDLHQAGMAKNQNSFTFDELS